jgi:hypothetical protein
MQVWTPGIGFDDRLLQLAVDLDVSGPRIFDLQIALTAFEHGAAELWTHDRNFLKIPGLRLVIRCEVHAALSRPGLWRRVATRAKTSRPAPRSGPDGSAPLGGSASRLDQAISP